MVTTVGTENDPKTIITNYILLERDAIAAYDAVIERLEDPGRKEKIAAFREDHTRHLKELQRVASEEGADAPDEGDAKEMLTTGKVKMANVVGGDGAILKAMSTNESDTVSAYQHGTENPDLPASLRPVVAAALEDEKRHKAWMEEAARDT